MNKTNKINEYHLWWVIIIKERLSTESRRRLEAKGFSTSAYSKSLKRHCPDLQRAKEIQDEVKDCLKKGDVVEVILLTDKQFGMSKSFIG